MSVSAERPAPDAYDRAPGRATLVFADDADLRRRLAASAVAAGARIVAAGAVADAAASIAAQHGTIALVLALAEDGGAPLDALLDGIDAGARAARLDAVLIAPVALIDILAARIAAVGTTILVDPSDAETEAALTVLAGARRAGVAEPGGDDDQRRLAELSEDTARIARALATLSERREGYRGAAAAAPGAILATATGMIRTRRMREQFFDPALFADPAWDMLLDLFVARLEQRRVAVSSLCIAAAVPPTTALRWITLMTVQGLIERRPDPADRRRMFLALSDRAAEAMAGYVAATMRHLAPAA